MQKYLNFRWQTLEIKRRKLLTFKMNLPFLVSQVENEREREDSKNEFVISLPACSLDVSLIFKNLFMVYLL